MGPNPTTEALAREGSSDRQTDRQARLEEGHAKTEADVRRTRGQAKDANHWWQQAEARREEERPLRPFEESTAPPAPRPCASGLQNCEMVPFCCFQTPVCGYSGWRQLTNRPNRPTLPLGPAVAGVRSGRLLRRPGADRGSSCPTRHCLGEKERLPRPRR